MTYEQIETAWQELLADFEQAELVMENGAYERELFECFYRRGWDAARKAAKPFLRAYAQLLWFNGQLKENEAVCRLLGEPSALEHEQGEDRP